MVRVQYNETIDGMNYTVNGVRFCAEQLMLLTADLADAFALEIPTTLHKVANETRGKRMYGAVVYRYYAEKRDNGMYDVVEEYEICVGDTRGARKVEPVYYRLSEIEIRELVAAVCNYYKKCCFDNIGSYISVANMESPTSGKAVENQFVVKFEYGTMLQSYKTNVAMVDTFAKKTFLDPQYNVSQTTSKYVNAFLGIDTKEREKQIKNGDIIIMNLNGNYDFE